MAVKSKKFHLCVFGKTLKCFKMTSHTHRHWYIKVLATSFHLDTYPGYNCELDHTQLRVFPSDMYNRMYDPVTMWARSEDDTIYISTSRLFDVLVQKT